MSILVSSKTNVVIQGITGKQGMKIAREMVDYGTNVVAGVTPGKAGIEVHGIPVYNSVAEAAAAHPEANTSLISVPRNQAMEAALEAMHCGKISLVNILTEGIPSGDAAYIVDYARECGVRVVGPASVGIISPRDKVKTGAIGGNDPGVFYPGNIAVFSKSGGMCMSLSLEIFNKLGYGVSIVVGIGGDKIIGTTFKDLLELIRDDPDTRLVILNGEVGGNYEEEAAEYIRSTGYSKRVVARLSGIGGEALFASGSRMGHAGAIIGEGSAGGYEGKVKALESAGVAVARSSEELITLVEREMPRRGPDLERAIASDVELVSISKVKLESLKTQARAVQTKTALTQLRNGVPYLRGYALPDLMEGASLLEAVYMVLKDADLNADDLRIFAEEWELGRRNMEMPEAALDAAKTSYEAGNSFNAACAAGLLAAPQQNENALGREYFALVHYHQVLAIIAHILGHDYSRVDDGSIEGKFFSALSGRNPTPQEADVARAMFIACIDHTPATPSSLSALTCYSGGNSLKTALAAGVSAMGDVHAGAGEGTSRLLQDYMKGYSESISLKGCYELDGVTITTIEELARHIVDSHTGKFGSKKRKIPGYGHRYYSMYGEDIRATALCRIAEQNGVAGPHIRLALMIESALKEEKSYGLCLNVDGAIGAITADMGISSKAGKATFIIPRSIGILGEMLEQASGSFFRLANESIVYNGPEAGRVYVPSGVCSM